ncbi:MAG: heavy-metal-associated domain-containing protein [Gemmatimonadetes bacterium]|nr:heavy-metal-associated domain-containing protein [Gemmatimonadota bacterium]
MRVAVQKLEGVEAIEVSLNRGLAVIRFRPDNALTVDQVRQVIQQSGFTPKEAEVRIAGRLTEQQGRLILPVGDRDRGYVLRERPGFDGVLAKLRAAALDREVVVEGLVPEPGDRGEGSWTLEVRRFSATSGT